MKEISTIGLDLAKNVFHVHGVDREEKVVVSKRLRRSQMIPFFRKLPPCLVGMEACAQSCHLAHHLAHHWARQLQALGHTVRIMPANYVKPYVKRNKNDARDAAAICEAVTRPTMRFVAVKSPEQQSLLMVHRTRALLVRQRTMLVNAMRAHNGTAGKARLGRISKQGDPYLRWLLVAGAMAVIRQGRKTNFAKMPWLADLMERKPTKVAAVALANKTARIAWALLVNDGTYRRPA